MGGAVYLFLLCQIVCEVAFHGVMVIWSYGVSLTSLSKVPVGLAGSHNAAEHMLTS